MRLLVLSFFTLMCSVSCVHFPSSPPPTEEAAVSSGSVELWLICGDLHSDFVVPTQWLLRAGCSLPASLHAYRYLCFGWGDQEAYTNRWGTEDIPKALFWPSQSIVHVVGFDGPVPQTFPQHEVISARVPRSQGPSLAAFLNDSFSYQDGQPRDPLTLRPAKWGHGYFIESPHPYYFPRMCNQWVSQALQRAGITTTRPTVTMSSQTLKRDLFRYNARR